ncbi:hypothetical protein [Brachybacterium paraconglomeratum]|uniref:hypothetical protein n=1 Tax=Brachybacterium paraconglomeratum TaxID=173362 RepID=UPI00026C6FC2|nr:hypothetical protein [Brachybacterium paraconglomeratum]
MAKPKRRSLSERNAEAIAGAVDNTSTREDGGVEQPPAPQPPAPAPADRPTAVSPAPPASEEPTRRSSVYLTPDDLRDVRSAYIVDFDHRPGSPGSFGLWAAGAIGELAALTVEERQAVRESLGPAGAGANRSQQLLVPDDVAGAVGDAMRQDRLAGVVDRSRSVFYSYALRWQARQAARRAGLVELPEPPARLPRLDLR